MAVKFSWKRDPTLPYPKTWMTFEARDVASDKLVKYSIRDLTDDRFEEAFHLMSTDYLLNEPMNAYLGCVKEDGVVERYRSLCLSVMGQRTPIACFKEGTDEIVAVNMVLVYSKVDDMDKQMLEFPKAKNEKITYEALACLYTDFNVYETYNVDKYLSCCGLSVAEKYRGRGIGLKLLQTRELLGRMFGIKIAHSDFTSNYSNPISEKAGFKIDRAFTYEELAKIDPKFNYPGIKHDGLSSRTWVFGE